MIHKFALISLFRKKSLKTFGTCSSGVFFYQKCSFCPLFRFFGETRLLSVNYQNATPHGYKFDTELVLEKCIQTAYILKGKPTTVQFVQQSFKVYSK